MNNNIINYRLATRYTDALIDIALKENQLDVVEKQLADLKKLFRADNSYVLKFAADMTLSKKVKKGVMSEILKKFGALKLIEDFFMLLFDNRRGFLIQYIFKSFYFRYNRIKNVRTATIESAVELKDDETRKVIDFLAKKTGRKIQLRKIVNPKIIGGFIIKYGDNTINCGISRNFEILQKKFLLN